MTNFVELAGSHKSPLPGSHPAGPVDSDELVTITLRVPSKGDLSKLEDNIRSLAELPFSKRKFFTIAELDQDFGAQKGHLDQLEIFGNQHNLSVVRRSSVERIIVLRGKLGDFMSAFRVNLINYHHRRGTYRGRTGPILIPESIQHLVTGVFGFDTRPKERSRYHHLSAAMSGPGGDNGVAATSFAQRYEFPQNLDGTGQTIGIIELGGGYRSSDLNIFFKEISVPPPKVAWISVDNGANNATGDPGGADGEVMLDIEVAGAVTPGAMIAVYFSPNTDQGFQDAISMAVHDTQREPSVISISWGESEDALSQQSLDAYHEVFVAAANLGVTVCAASGDHGSVNIAGPDWLEQPGIVAHVNHPACDPYVLACGGTQIKDGTDVVWNDGTAFDVNAPGGGGWATGGGISGAFGPPSYQANVNVPVNAVTGQAGRGVPDVALSATDYFTRVDGSESASGGTSAATPLMASLIAQMSQSIGHKLGLLHPFLYNQARSNIFIPITSGTNEIANSGVPGYSAAPGEIWNGCTGLGIPIGQSMLHVLTSWAMAGANEEHLIEDR